MFDHADPEGELEDVIGELLPAEVRLGTHQDEHLALGQPSSSHGQLRPSELGRLTVHDVEHRPVVPIVEQEVRSEAGDDLSPLGDVRCGSRRRLACVHPV